MLSAVTRANELSLELTRRAATAQHRFVWSLLQVTNDHEKRSMSVLLRLYFWGGEP